MIIDDSIQDKCYSQSIELVKAQYSGAVGGLVRGIGGVNLGHGDGQEHYVKLKKVPFKVKLFKLVAPDGDID